MATRLKLVNGLPFMVNDTVPYDATLTVVGGTPGTNQINIVDAGGAITLPNSKTYTDADLQVFLNNNRLYLTTDYNYVGSGARTQISLTFGLEVGDLLGFYINRDA